jgi:hypothetical protein
MWRTSRYLFILAFFCVANQGISASVYYTSPTANSSGTGTITSPYLFASAIGKLVAGDTLWVRGGTYNSSVRYSITKSGVATNLIHILAYTDEQPLFDFRTQAYNSSNQGISLSGNYIEIKGLIIQAAGDNGMYVTGSFDAIENCVFRWNCDSGLQLKTGTNNLVKNCDSYENFDYESVNSDGSPNYGGNADGFADKQYTNISGANTFVGCRSWRNADDGWDHYAKVGNTIDQNCWCYRMGPAQFDMTSHPRYATDATYLNNFKQPDGTIIIPNYGNGNGFKTGGNYTANNITLTNCLSVNNKVKGFDQNNNNGVITIYNCSSYGNNPNYGFTNNSYGTLIVKNCISLDGMSSDRFNCKSTTTAYNTWNSGFSSSDNDFQSVDATQIISPRQSDGSLPEVSFMRLIGNSKLIDVGTNVGLPYFGSAPDLGAFEYSETTPVNNLSANKTFNVFPNPVVDKIMLDFEGDANENVHIMLLDISGSLVKTFIVSAVTGHNSFSFDCSNLPHGNYLCKISGSRVNEVVKLIR